MRTFPRDRSSANPIALHAIPLRDTQYATRITFILALLALLLATGWAPAPQVDDFVVVGQVTNGTSGGTVPADLPVALHVFSGMEETETYTATLAADGSFRFDGLSLGEGDSFVARVVYQDVVYASDLVTFEPGQQEIALPVTVYEVTDDPGEVQITQVHLFITGEGDCIQVMEYRMVGNTGDRTFVGVENPETGQRITLHVTLPDGADTLIFDGPGLGERFLEQEGGFADTEPIPPGNVSTRIIFGYELPYREGMEVEHVFDASVASVVILLSAEGLALEGEGIVSGGAMDTEMGPALSYTAGPLAVGETLAFTLVPRPDSALPTAPAGSLSARDTAREISVGLVALAAAVATVYWLYRSSAPGPLPAQARPLVEKIATLDGDFEAGRVKEGAYRKKRGALKRQLRNLVKE